MKIKLLILSAIILMCSCSNGNGIIEEPPTDPIPDNPKEYVVSFGFTGEITNIEESPLSRAVTNDMYGIQVYSMPATETDQSKYKPYAYGQFNNKENMSIKLIEGYKYKFKSTMIVDGINRSQYGFLIIGEGGGWGQSNNLFSYSSTNYMPNLDKSTIFLKPDAKEYNRPNVDRYYGILDNYVASQNELISIEMKRVVFGAKVIADGLSGGCIKVSLAKAPVMSISYPATECEDIFTFENERIGGSSWHEDGYSESIQMSILWEKPDGVIIPLIAKEITFKRNKKTTITVKVKDNSINNGVDISNENTPMGDGGNITIDTGNGTDTGVNPNP